MLTVDVSPWLRSDVLPCSPRSQDDLGLYLDSLVRQDDLRARIQRDADTMAARPRLPSAGRAVRRDDRWLRAAR